MKTNNARTASYLAIINELKANPPQLFNGERVLIVDGLNTFFRAYCSSPVLGSNGQHMGGITGFLLSLGYAIKVIKPTRVVITFDGKGGSQRRKKIHSEYKAHRTGVVNVNRAESSQFTIEEEQQQQRYQLLRLVEYIRMLPVTIITVDNIEADDVIAYITHKLHSDQLQSYVMSRDKDFYQLLKENVFVWSPTKKQIIDSDQFVEEFNVLPQNYVLIRAIVGDDHADNIKGIKGVGVKTLMKYFPQLSTRDQVLSVNDIIQFAQEKNEMAKKPNKIYQQIVLGRDIIERNIQLMDLTHFNFSTSAKIAITDQYNKPVPKLDRIAFFRMLAEDGIDSAIRNAEVWLREVFASLAKSK